MKKIAICINSLAKGGAERVVSIISNYLILDYDITVITMTKNDISYQLDSKIHIIEIANSKNKIKNKIIKRLLLPFKVISRIKKVKRLFKKEKYDLIISFLPEASFMALMSKGKNDKLIISDRNDPKVEYKNIFYKFLMKNLYPKANGFVFQTDEAKSYFDGIVDFNKTKSEIIYNPVNENFMCDRYEGKRDKEIVSVGRFEKQKNFMLLLESFAIVHKKFPDYKLVIYGDGSLRNEYEEFIKNNALVDYVELPGIISDVKDKIIKSSLFVMSSDYEGMPNSLIEAMCLGLTVISTDCPCGGPKMLINNKKNGLLVKVGDKEELTQAMLLLLNDEHLRNLYGREAVKIVDKVNPNNICKKWKNFIENSLGDGEDAR